MAPAVEDAWLGRGPAVDLAGTVVGMGGGDVDLLASPADLARWLRLEEPWLGPAPDEAALRLADFRALRDAVRALFAAGVAGGGMPGDAVRAVNAVSGAVPTFLALDATDPASPAAVQAGAAASPTARILAAIARSAIEIVGGPDRERLRACGAPRCGRYYRATRPGQVWCSSACGNRARVARHHRRRLESARSNRLVRS